MIQQLVLALRVKQGPGNTPKYVCMYGGESHTSLFNKVVLTGFAELINIWFVCLFGLSHVMSFDMSQRKAVCINFIRICSEIV